jgi:predicted MFS family arabinose efflux permease
LFEKRLSARGGSPLVQMELFHSPGYARGLLSILLLFSGIASFAFTLTYYLQQGLRVHPQQVGIIFSALSISFLIASLGAVKVVQRIGAKTLLVGLTIMQIGQLLLIAIPLYFGARLNPFFLMPILFLYGLGQGLSVPQIIRQTLAEVPLESAGAAAGVLNTVQQVAFSLGVSVVGSVFFAFIPKTAVSFDYAKALAVSFACNFAFVLIARFLVANNIRHMARLSTADLPLVVEA